MPTGDYATHRFQHNSLRHHGFAWIGHFFFEHNRPATFRQPLFSLMGDWRMYWQIVTRQLPF